MDLRKSFNIRLAQLGINKKEFAESVGVSPAYISQVTTNGSMSIKKLAELCERMNIKVWQFIKLGEDDE